MQRDSALDIVADWHSALNSGQVDQMVELVRPDVEVGGLDWPDQIQPA